MRSKTGKTKITVGYLGDSVVFEVIDLHGITVAAREISPADAQLLAAQLRHAARTCLRRPTEGQ